MLQRLSIICLLVFTLAVPVYAQAPTKGVVQIKINPSIEPAMIRQHRANQQTTTPVRLNLGIRQFDAVNQQFNAARLRRIFPDAGEYEALHREAGLHLWYELYIDATADVKEAVAAYAGLTEVEQAGVVYPIKRIQQVNSEIVQHEATPVASATANDPHFPRQWHYKNTGTNGYDGVAGMDINLENAWDKTQGNNTVIVAVVDGGIDYTHPDLAGNMWPGIGKNFVTPANGVTAHDHGTHVAGTIAALSNNTLGVAGIAGGTGAGDGVRLMSCQVFEGEDKGVMAANAIVYGADNGAVISQNSWGYNDPGVYNAADSVAIKYFIDHAGKNPDGTPRSGTKMVGGIVIFAAGNEQSSGKWYPGYFDFVTTVASAGSKGRRAYYSNYGPWVDITAPGGDYYNTGSQSGFGVLNRAVLSTVPVASTFIDTVARGYGYMQGTSMACPHVSGIAALVLSRLGSETYTPAMLYNRLVNAVQPLTGDPYYANGWMGSGLIDAAMAVADYVPVTDINIDANLSVYINHSTTYTATVLPVNATDRRVEWSSSDETIATIDNNGTVQGLALGTVTITATSKADANYKVTTVLTVTPIPVESIRLYPESTTINRESNLQLQAIFAPFDATDQSVQWNSSHSSIASVDEAGVVWGESVGTAVITATANDGGHTSSSTVTVVQPVTGVALNHSNIRLLVGDTLTLNATISPHDAYNQSVFWSSSNNTVASVIGGKLQAGQVGTARITVRTNDGGYIAECTVTVYDAVQAPEGFSPNGDGINDYFELVLDSQESYTLIVFDRSGQVHYRADNYNNDWDGTANTGKYNGSKVPAGTYFYQLTGRRSGSKSGYVVIKY